MRSSWSTDTPVSVEDVEGLYPLRFITLPSRSMAFTRYVVRTPADNGRFPFVFLGFRHHAEAQVAEARGDSRTASKHADLARSASAAAEL